MSKIAGAKTLRSVVFGSVIGMVASALILSVMALIISFGFLPSAVIFPMAYAATMLGGFASGYGSAKINGDKGLICGLFSAMMFFALALLFGCITGKTTLGTDMLIRIVAIMLSGAIGGIIGVN